MKIKARYILWVPVVVALTAAVILVIQTISPAPVVLTGLVECSEVDVASKIPGRVDSIFVQEGDHVRAGQKLAQLGSREINAKVEQAAGAMMAARAKLEMARRGARPEEKEQAAKMYETAKHQFELAEKTYQRVVSVYKDSVISTQEHDQVEFQYKAAREQLAAAHAKYQLVLHGARDEEVKAAEGLAHQAENAFEEASAYQAETVLISPIQGEVFKRLVDPGEMAAAGYPVFTLVNLEDVWIVLQIREDQMTGLRKGQILKGVVPALGPEQHAFKITYIASMADFATWRATNQKGDFDLKTFELHLRPQDAFNGLLPGMTVRIIL